MSVVFLLISGKAYSIFALLFGLSFFIQMDRNQQKGIDFRSKFVWRMVILLIFGVIHSLIYRGDILHIYALLAFPLILLYKVPNKYLWLLSVLLLIQIPLLYQLTQSFMDPQYVYKQSLQGYFGLGNTLYEQDSFTDIVRYNLWKGRVTVWAWTYYNGRYLQLFTLFIIGMLLGRKRIFEKLPSHRKSFIKLLFVGFLSFLFFQWVQVFVEGTELSQLQKGFFGSLITSFSNLAITAGLIALIALIYLKFQRVLVIQLFASYGKMSLSNYIFQALFGVVFFYGFGLGMYKYLGAT